jgi:hypothetical protein
MLCDRAGSSGSVFVSLLLIHKLLLGVDVIMRDRTVLLRIRVSEALRFEADFVREFASVPVVPVAAAVFAALIAAVFVSTAFTAAALGAVFPAVLAAVSATVSVFIVVTGQSDSPPFVSVHY